MLIPNNRAALSLVVYMVKCDYEEQYKKECGKGGPVDFSEHFNSPSANEQAREETVKLETRVILADGLEVGQISFWKRFERRRLKIVE
jgi:hypothetical protein